MDNEWGQNMELQRQSNQRPQRAAVTGRATPSTPAPQPSQPVAPVTHTPRGSKVKWFVLTPLAIILLLGSGYGLGSYFPLSGGEYSRVNTDQYQAVFLANDQVYFGKITSITDNALVMEDIYYLQSGNSQTADTKQPTEEQGDAMSLAKLGNELHAPQDVMQINRDQVLYWENLRPDGKVTEAIKAYKR